MFQFPGFALKTLCIQVKSTCFTQLFITMLSIIEYQVGFPIRRSMVQSLFSAYHSLSQSITSFIASYCQGIHQTPFSRLIWSRRRQAFCVSYQRYLKIAKFWTKSHTKLFPQPPLVQRGGYIRAASARIEQKQKAQPLKAMLGIIVLNLEQNYFVNCLSA